MSKEIIAELKAALVETSKKMEDQAEQLKKWRGLAEEREKQLSTKTESISDLKTRLSAAETANQFLRGYVARVQEDDVVREEMLTTGDPDGAQQLVPKRKPTQFERPCDFTEPTRLDDLGYFRSERDRQQQAKHWITY